MADEVHPHHWLSLFRDRGAAFQLIRYVLAGGLTTTVYSAVYLVLVSWVFPGPRAAIAVPPAFIAALVTGFYLHSRWSFAGHGTRENSGRQHAKFALVHSAGFALNLASTWILTARLGAPAWTSLVPAVTIIPMVSFLLQRRWVFA